MGGGLINFLLLKRGGGLLLESWALNRGFTVSIYLRYLLRWNLDITKAQGTSKINMLAIKRFHYIEVLFHILHYSWNKIIVRYTEDIVHYRGFIFIMIPPYFTVNKIRADHIQKFIVMKRLIKVKW